MRLYLVHFLFIAGIIAPVVPTRFYISGTVSCQSSPPWCYTIQLLELDSNFNDVITSVSGCELTNPNQKFSFEGWQPWDGLFDWHFELELLIKHDCGLEITDEKQSMRLSFGQFYRVKHTFKKEVNIDLSKNTTEVIVTPTKSWE
ncbi:hypothetical protein L5515_018552 [Caenorhabditis briggsae]|uniref:Uncharacterized protein n=1 Tax=Caenorhabditis briggsae TaxID=6238 RepID=A0AAE9FIE7_CAEBR|nr:hypothetical protein L3Y34_012696 [Caenorhabditis briggsae]UMM42895.1 hypothetical protein L5515_018552 [Caenorhabditis briggsae]